MNPSLLDLMVDWLHEVIGPGHRIGAHVTNLLKGMERGDEHALHVDGRRIGWVHTETAAFECTATSHMLYAADPLFFDKVWGHLEHLDATAKAESTYDPTHGFTTYIE